MAVSASSCSSAPSSSIRGSVRFSVRIEIASVSEAFTAGGALERLSAGVHRHVSLHRRLLRETLATYLAAERLLSGVGPHVDFDSLFVSESSRQTKQKTTMRRDVIAFLRITLTSVLLSYQRPMISIIMRQSTPSYTCRLCMYICLPLSTYFTGKWPFPGMRSEVSC